MNSIDNELYKRAVECVIKENKASTSYIQRRLDIGYNLAATIIEQMEREGIVSAADHIGRRVVQMKINYKNISYSGEELAEKLSDEARERISLLEGYLKKSLSINYVLDKDEEKEACLDSCLDSCPELKLLEYNMKPSKNDEKYKKKLSIFITIICFFVVWLVLMDAVGDTISFFLALSFGMIAQIADWQVSKKKFYKDKNLWLSACKKIDIQNNEIKDKYEKDLSLWQKEKKRRQQKVENLFDAYDNGDEEGIIYVVNKWLKKLPLITDSHNESVISYNSENKILVINYFLPNYEEFQELPKEVKYIKSRYETKTTYYSESFIKKLYDSLIYQILFAVANAIYSGDIAKKVSAININGYLDTIDKSLGKQITICIASLLIDRKSFNELNLDLIDPKECFKRLKGLAAPQLQNKIPVKPIMQLNKEDKRFVESYGVAENIDGQTNLASMDWQDFENLIRELFEKKFSRHGGECKVTQASRDGGVDAIAFDPDPILGGKIIIQAKRYTNVVGVSAVRDLYGTLINEGASKGILITTSDYGSDAHKFAEGKPLVLINGNNLLQLLDEELNTKAYINISEAKKVLKEMEKK